MALTLNQGKKSAHEALFSKLLTSEADKELLVEVTVNTNAEYVVGFYNVSVSFVYGGHKGDLSIELPATTTAIMKGQVDSVVLTTCQSMLRTMLEKVKAIATGDMIAPKKMPKIGAIEALDEVGAAEAPPAKKPKASPFMVPPAVAAKPSPPQMPAATGNVVKLSEALAVGQKVQGTSAGSIYHTVAVNDRVKIAMRLTSGKVSVRAEGAPTKKEQECLSNVGMSNHGKYWSMHLSLEDVPPARTVGALLMGMGIEFDHQLTKFKELPNED